MKIPRKVLFLKKLRKVVLSLVRKKEQILFPTITLLPINGSQNMNFLKISKKFINKKVVNCNSCYFYAKYVLCIA